MRTIFSLLFFVLLFAACSKDKYETKPTVKIESFGPDVVEFGDVIRLVATVTDNEGDLQDSVIFVRNRYEGSVRINSDSNFVSNLQKLGVPDRRKIELEFLLPYGQMQGNLTQIQNTERGRDREFAISVIVYDKAGNKSEPVETRKILLKKE